MKIANDKAIFDTGKRITVFFGTIGLMPNLNITSGYDKTIFSEEAFFHDDNELTRDELLELADYMIFQWMNLRSKAEAMEGKNE